MEVLNFESDTDGHKNFTAWSPVLSPFADCTAKANAASQAVAHATFLGATASGTYLGNATCSVHYTVAAVQE